MIKKDYYHDDQKRGTPYDQKIGVPYAGSGVARGAVPLFRQREYTK